MKKYYYTLKNILRFATVVLATGMLVLLFSSVSPAQDDVPAAPPSMHAADHLDDQGGKIDLSWEASSSPNILYYRVYRSEEACGPFIRLAERCTEDFIDYLSYVDVDLENGKLYFYRVTAVDWLGRESLPSPVASAIPTAQDFQLSFTVSKSIVISLAQQRLYCLENNRIVGVFRCSTGAPSTPTPPGNYRVLYHARAMPITRYPGTVCYYWLAFTANAGIHAWPAYNGRYSNYSSLGQPVSHGCVRLHPNEAPVVYYWAPDGIPVIIIPGPYIAPPPPIADGHESLGATTPSNSWYFAEGYTGESFNEYLLVLNPNPEPSEVIYDFMLPGGSIIQRAYTVSGNSRFTLHVDSIPGLESTNNSTRITSTLPIVAERAMYFDYAGIDGGSNTLGATAPSSTWYFAEGFTGGSFDEYLCLQNPGDQPQDVHLTFYIQGGGTRAFDCQIQPHSRHTVKVDDIPGMESVSNSVFIASSEGIIAERVMYFDYGGCRGGHCTVGATSLSQNWYLAEGCTIGRFDTYVVIENPHSSVVTAMIKLVDEGGGILQLNQEISPNSRFTLKVDDLPGFGSTSFSAQVSSVPFPLMVERSMYFNQAGRDGGHCSVGAGELSNNWYFAEGYTGDYFDSFLVVENPDPVETAHITVTFMLPQGEVHAFGYDISPSSRFTLWVDQLPGFSSTNFSAKIESPTVPLVAERAMYFCILR